MSFVSFNLVNTIPVLNYGSCTFVLKFCVTVAGYRISFGFKVPEAGFFYLTTLHHFINWFFDLTILHHFVNCFCFI